MMFNHDEGRFRGDHPGSDIIVEDSLCAFDVSQTTVEGDGGMLTINWHITPKAAFTGDKIVWLQVYDFDSNRLRIPEIGSWSVSVGQTYEISMGVSPTGSGTTSPPVGTHHFAENEVVAITATANTGYRFVNWSGDAADPNAPSTTVTVDASKAVTANFEVIPAYTLTMAVSPADGGTTSPAAGDHNYSEGEVVTVTATANTGYRFVNWSGDVADPNAPSTTVTVDMTKTVTANFEPIPVYTLTMAVSPGEGGTTSPAAGDHSYSEGELVSIAATANPGYRFVNWSGDVADLNAPSTIVTVDSTKTVTANFESIPVYTLTMAVSLADSGITSPAAGDHDYSQGEVVAITATANTGYRFINWSGDVADPNAASTTVTVDSTKTVTANFEESGLTPEPSFISLIPDSGASSVGVPHVLSITVGDGDGYEDIQFVRMEIRDASGTGTDDDTIILDYWGQNNKVMMFNHDEGRYRGGRPGSDIIVEDSLGTFDVSQTTVEGDGGMLTINWHVTPKAAFTGDKIIWLQVYDSDSNRLRIPVIGTWTVLP
jgi:hypothetical protein